MIYNTIYKAVLQMQTHDKAMTRQVTVSTCF